MKRAKLLIVDDEEKILQTMKGSLEDEDYEVLTARDGQEAMEKVRTENPDLVFLDVWLPGMDGMETLKAIKEYDTNTDVVVMTGHGTINTAVQAIKLGASNFLEKPLSLDSVLSVVNIALEQRRAMADEVPPTSKKEELLGKTAIIMSIKEKTKRLSRNNKNAIITGESGTGKELVARLIHNHSSRRKNPLIKFNCSIYSSKEIGQELFGISLSSSTRKDLQKIGALEKASKGTLFIDSIDEMSLKTQKKLVKSLKQEAQKTSTKNGKNGKLNGTIILASSTTDLPLMVKEGKFNEELYSLLGENIIFIPPLRERKGDKNNVKTSIN